MEQSGVSPLTLRLVRSNPSGNKRMMVAFLCKKYNINQDFTTNWKETEITFSRKPKSFREEFSIFKREIMSGGVGGTCFPEIFTISCIR